MSETKDLLILMYLHHRAKQEEVGRCCDLDVLHWPHYQAQLIAVMAHHRATVDKVFASFFASAAMGGDNVFEVKTLRRTRYFRLGAGGYF